MLLIAYLSHFDLKWFDISRIVLFALRQVLLKVASFRGRSIRWNVTQRWARGTSAGTSVEHKFLAGQCIQISTADSIGTTAQLRPTKTKTRTRRHEKCDLAPTKGGHL